LKNILKEFDQQYENSKSGLEKEIQSKYEYYKDNVSYILRNNLIQMLKYNDAQYKIGITTEEDGVVKVSPYAKVRDIILGEQDFIKKQNNIIRFVEKFARSHKEGENIHWLYCVETDEKLLPVFLYELASKT
jgi:hypothetical protein